MNITIDTSDLQELKDELGHIRQMNVQLREENERLRGVIRAVDDFLNSRADWHECSRITRIVGEAVKNDVRRNWNKE